MDTSRKVGRRASRTVLQTPIVPHAPQRGNALRDAPRHRSVPHCILKRGRRASRTA
ncbi:hypothetical protein CCL11_18685, partial [Pseudomonas syringae]